MKQRARQIYSRQNELKISAFERKFLRSIYKELKAFNMQFVHILKERGVEALKSALSRTMLPSEGIGHEIKKLYVVVGVYSARKTYQEIINSTMPNGKFYNYPIINKVIGSTVPGGQINFNEKWANDLLDYFRMFLIDKAVVPITIQSKDRIMAIVNQGTAEGWTIERMAKELETDKMLLWRARLIVRTETAKAAYYGRRLGAVDSGYETLKEWISAHDIRTRHSHRDMDGETIEMNGRYKVPLYKGRVLVGYEMMKGPGDPEASAQNVCNCRCTEAYAAKRDENGRLMRKPTTRVSIIQPNEFIRPHLTVTI